MCHAPILTPPLETPARYLGRALNYRACSLKQSSYSRSSAGDAELLLLKWTPCTDNQDEQDNQECKYRIFPSITIRNSGLNYFSGEFAAYVCLILFDGDQSTTAAVNVFHNPNPSICVLAVLKYKALVDIFSHFII